MDLAFTGTVVAEQPISITAPRPEGRPVDRLYHRRLVQQPSGERVETLVIPATTLRGKLRRAAVTPLARAARDGGSPWSLDAFYFNVIGQTRSSEEEREYVPLDEIAAQRAANPVVSLFGAGIGLASKLMVADAVPEVPTVGEEFRSVRKDVDAEPTWTTTLLDPAAFAEWSRRARANKLRARAVQERDKRRRERGGASAEKRPEIDQEIQALEREIESLEQEAGSGVSTKGVFPYLAIPQGVVMAHRIRVKGLTEPELGVLVAAIDGLSLDPVVGGQIARGCGEIRAEYRVLFRNAGDREFHDVGEVAVGGFRSAVWTLADAAAAAVFDRAREAYDILRKNAAAQEWRPLDELN